MTSATGNWTTAWLGLGRVLAANLPPPKRSAPLWTDERGSLSRAEFFSAARRRQPRAVVSETDQREVALQLVATLLRGHPVHLLSPRAGRQAHAQLAAARPVARGLGRVYVSSTGTTTGLARPVRSRRDLRALGQLVSPLGALPRLHRPVVVGLTPIDHGHGLVLFLLTLALGGHYVHLSPVAAARLLPRKPRVDQLSGVPTQLADLADALTEPLPRPARIVLSGSDRLRPELADRLEHLVGPVWNAYGSTETGTVCLAGPVDRALDPDCVGRPLAGVRISETSAGRLRIASPIAREPFAGDAGWVGEDGLVRVTGRADGLLVSGGETVSRAALRRLLAGLPGVQEVVVEEAPDPRFGTRPAVRLLVSAEAGLDAEGVRELVRQELGDAQVPGAVAFEAADPDDQ